MDPGLVLCLYRLYARTEGSSISRCVIITLVYISKQKFKETQLN